MSSEVGCDVQMRALVQWRLRFEEAGGAARRFGAAPETLCCSMICGTTLFLTLLLTQILDALSVLRKQLLWFEVYV